MKKAHPNDVLCVNQERMADSGRNSNPPMTSSDWQNNSFEIPVGCVCHLAMRNADLIRDHDLKVILDLLPKLWNFRGVFSWI